LLSYWRVTYGRFVCFTFCSTPRREGSPKTTVWTALHHIDKGRAPGKAEAEEEKAALLLAVLLASEARAATAAAVTFAMCTTDRVSTMTKARVQRAEALMSNYACGTLSSVTQSAVLAESSAEQVRVLFAGNAFHKRLLHYCVLLQQYCDVLKRCNMN
jgi:hypothetical protein